jgi:hypothetical protein
MRAAGRGIARLSLLLPAALLAFLAAGCSTLAESVHHVTPSYTPFQPLRFTLTPTMTPTTIPSPTPPPSPTPEIPGIWADSSVPDGLRAQVTLPSGWQWVLRPEQALVRLEPVMDSGKPEASWVYAVAVPFSTVIDTVNPEDLIRSWQGQSREVFDEKPLLAAPDTLSAFQPVWGAASGDVQAIPADTLVDSTWDLGTWALVPFEQLQPRWKVLKVGGSSVLKRGELEGYPLVLGFRLNGDQAALERFAREGGSLPVSNRDPTKLSVVLMTGTTALVRATAWRMETRGLDYPAGDILDWLTEPDLTHISNEASFNAACPPANPIQTSLVFCSRPEYIQLLDAIGADIIELSGNHNNDWGRDAFTYSLDLYRQRGWRWFAGGENSEQARQPLLIEHNGNRLAFLGCNFAGPPAAWATVNQPGAARCDLDWYAQQLGELRAQGYLPVMTFQYNEIYVPFASERQVADFGRLAAAGAVIVSGSQAHFPQGFAFESGSYIHYGLGNLFFDQMDIPVVGTRREFLDRHVFYDGRYISTELLTAMLEDYARPRPMTEEERRNFLTELFAASNWK